jgi:subtilisin family serine protease
MTPLRVTLTLFLCLVLTMSLAAASLTDAEKGKLHPLLQQLLTEGKAPDLLKKQSAGEMYDLIVLTSDPGVLRTAGVEVNTVETGFATVRADAAGIARLARLASVRFVDPGSINVPMNDVSVPQIGATALAGGLVNGTAYTGEGVIVAVFDTGIDWAHLDFRNPSDPTKSRILWIWDQTLTPTGAETMPADFSYGVEYSNAQINDELDGSPAGFVRERDTNGHGTHVTGSAAGNGATLGGKYAGVAPRADIIFIKGGNTSFSESRMIDGLTYVHKKATALGKPVVINYSIGGHYGPHDGTRTYETAMNSFVSTPGRIVVVSAGNDGNGSIHAGGTLGADAVATFTFTVPAYTPTSGTGNDEFFFDLWLGANTGVSATITSPNGVVFTRAAGETGDSPTTTDGTITLWNYISTLNSKRNVQCWVHDATSATPASGTWTLTITNTTSSAQSYDGWLASRLVCGAAVTVAGGDNAKTVSMPGTSAGAITVASWVTRWGWPAYTGSNRVYNGTDRTSNISSFSSIGPTRDGRQKPDLAAPGQGIISVLSTSADTSGQSAYIVPGQKHWVMQGTSMAAPHVTGAAALLLQHTPSLTTVQAKAVLTATADVDGFTGSTWNATWGYGKMDLLEALARQNTPGATITRKTFAYDAATINATLALTGSGKLAVRFTPDVTGRLTAVVVNATTINNRPIIGAGPLRCEVFTNSGGNPGTKLGTTVQHPLQMLNAGTPNYIQMLGTGVSVTSGTEYFIVLSQTNATDTLIVRTDTVTSATRSRVWNGSAWTGLAANIRMGMIVAYGSGVSAVGDDGGAAGDVPATYSLDQNYPNPFNPATTIRFAVPMATHAVLKIYDILGQEVATLVDDRIEAGTHTVQWSPVGLASGVYLYRLEAGSYSAGKKLILLK